MKENEHHVPMVPRIIRLYIVPSTMRRRNNPTEILTRLIPVTMNMPRKKPILMTVIKFFVYAGSVLCRPTPCPTSSTMHTITAMLNTCANCQPTSLSSSIVLVQEPNPNSGPFPWLEKYRTG